MEEKLTIEDCSAIEFLRGALRPRNAGAFDGIRGSVGIQYQGKTLYITSHAGKCAVGETPQVTIHEEWVTNSPCADGAEMLASILKRVGTDDLDNRIARVQQERLWNTWGGREEYEKIFFWLKNGKEHSDADWVDNICIECGRRGLEKFEQRCSGCMEAT